MYNLKNFIDGTSPRLVWIDHAGEEQAISAHALQNELRAAAKRQASELTAGHVQWKRWIHPDDALALTEYADKLACERAGYSDSFAHGV